MKKLFSCMALFFVVAEYSMAETSSFSEKYNECFSDLQLLQSVGGTPRISFLRGPNFLAVEGTDGKLTVYTAHGATIPSTKERACEYSKETIADAIIKITAAVQDLKKPVDPKDAAAIGSALMRVKASCAKAEPGIADYLNPHIAEPNKIKSKDAAAVQ